MQVKLTFKSQLRINCKNAASYLVALFTWCQNCKKKINKIKRKNASFEDEQSAINNNYN